ncbi:MAG: hypothetical protein JXR40_11510 [Pontiellaceae bacterium]|nr:hypothetical protein [Pontiellaceae bacterium]
MISCTNLTEGPNADDGDRTFGDDVDIGIDILKNNNGNELIGTFYDLKQAPDGSITEIGERAKTDSFGRETQQMATEVIDKFIRSGCNPRRLEDYFKAPKYKSAKTFMMPPMSADRAPEAFRVQDQVKGSYWVCHYTGQIAAPETGRYRFCGIGDDVLVVRVGKKVVLDASWPELIGQVTSWESDDDNSRRFSMNGYKYGGFCGDVWNQLYSQIEKSGGFDGEEKVFGSALRDARAEGVNANDNYMSAACRMVIGDWVELKKGQPVNIDVVIGEIPGGEFTCRLLIEQQGKEYQMVRSDAGMRPVLPVFKTVELDGQLVEQIELDPNEMTVEGPVFGVKENSIK